MFGQRHPCQCVERRTLSVCGTQGDTQKGRGRGGADPRGRDGESDEKNTPPPSPLVRPRFSPPAPRRLTHARALAHTHTQHTAHKSSPPPPTPCAASSAPRSRPQSPCPWTRRPAGWTRAATGERWGRGRQAGSSRGGARERGKGGGGTPRRGGGDGASVASTPFGGPAPSPTFLPYLHPLYLPPSSPPPQPRRQDQEAGRPTHPAARADPTGAPRAGAGGGQAEGAAGVCLCVCRERERERERERRE